MKDLIYKGELFRPWRLGIGVESRLNPDSTPIATPHILAIVAIWFQFPDSFGDAANKASELLLLSRPAQQNQIPKTMRRCTGSMREEGNSESLRRN